MEQGLEVGHSRTNPAGAALQQWMSYRQGESSPSPRVASVTLRASQREPTPRGGPGTDPELASVSRHVAFGSHGAGRATFGMPGRTCLRAGADATAVVWRPASVGRSAAAAGGFAAGSGSGGLGHVIPSGRDARERDDVPSGASGHFGVRRSPVTRLTACRRSHASRVGNHHTRPRSGTR